MDTQVKTIDIQAKEWFERLTKTHYFSGLITTNLGTKSEKQYEIPFQYGYAVQCEKEAFRMLKERDIINTTYYKNLQDKHIIVRSTIITGCKKSELRKAKSKNK